MKLVRCSLLPTCDNPETDLATPTDGVDPNVDGRLWKRQARMNKKFKIGQDADGKGPERVVVRFPWNDACRNAAKGEAVNRSKCLTKVRPGVMFANIKIRGAVCVAQAGRNH